MNELDRRGFSAGEENMNRDEIVEMLKDIVSEIDYDIYKEMFVYDQDEADRNHQLDPLVAIVEKHI